MKLKVDSNYIFAALGAAGAGAPIFWPEQKWIGGLLLIAAFVVFVLGIRIEGLSIRFGTPHLGAHKLNAYVAAMIASALVFVVAAIGYWMDRAKGPILWNWGPNSPIAISMSTGEPLWVDGFSISGENRSDDLIIPTAAFVQSDLDGQIVPLKFAGADAPVELDQAAIQGHRKFFLVTLLPSQDEHHSHGISADAFRRKFPSFTFVFESEGAPRLTKRFDEIVVDKLLLDAERTNHGALKEASEVMPGSGIVARPKPSVSPSPSHPDFARTGLGVGGRGGSARVVGNGTAIGGPGGAAGKYGKGGDGGSAEVIGAGLAAGGAGGAAGEDGVWRAPAKSGYEVAQRQLGLPVDPVMRQYGRGGAVPGYEPKLQIVEQLRTAYFAQHELTPQSIFENIGAVPTAYLNESLTKRGEDWRVRIVADEYEFFLPGH